MDSTLSSLTAKIESSIMLFGPYGVTPQHPSLLSAEFLTICFFKEGQIFQIKLSFKHIKYVEIVDYCENKGSGLVFYVNSHMAKKIQQILDEEGTQFLEGQNGYFSNSYFIMDVINSDPQTINTIREILRSSEAFHRKHLINQYNKTKGRQSVDCLKYTHVISFNQWVSQLGMLDKSVNIGKYTPENSPDSYPNNQICPFSMTSSFVAHGTEKFLGMLLDDSELRDFESAVFQNNNTLLLQPCDQQHIVAENNKTVLSPNTSAIFPENKQSCSAGAASGSEDTTLLDSKTPSKPVIKIISPQVTPSNSISQSESPATPFSPRVLEIQRNSTPKSEIPEQNGAKAKKVVLKSSGPSTSSETKSIPHLKNTRSQKREVHQLDDESPIAKNNDGNAFAYPPSGRESVTVTFRDLKLLGFRYMLNDSLIDFYLKYIKYGLLSPERSKKVYTFNTFFYTRLTQAPSNQTATGNRLKRISANYQVLKAWTKRVDLFDMDYIVVPINEDIHWCLAIILDPRAGIRSQNTENTILNLDSQLNVLSVNPPKTSVSRPQIVVFDSLVEPFVDRHEFVRCNLAEYLNLEYENKKRDSRSYFDKSSLEVIVPRSLPQQRNYIDCGVFLLQFADLFLTNPPKNLTSNSSFADWYPEFHIKNKRIEIQNIILNLAQNVRWSDFLIRLPQKSSKKNKKTKKCLTKEGVPIPINENHADRRERRYSESSIYRIERDEKYTQNLCRHRSLDSVRGPIEELGLLPTVDDIRQKYGKKNKR